MPDIKHVTRLWTQCKPPPPRCNHKFHGRRFFQGRRNIWDTLNKQEEWPPGSPDAVCPHRPVMTQVQHWGKTARTDHVTQQPWPSTLEVMTPVADAGHTSSIRIPSLKFVGLVVRKIWRTMYVSINGPGDPDLWPFDLESGLLVASKVGNIPSKIGHVRPLRSRIICYVRDKRCRTDRQMDGRTVISNAYCPIPTDGGITNEWHLFRSRSCRFHFISFVSLTMPPTTRNGHTTSNHCKQKPNPKLKITKIHEMHIAHKT